MSDIHVYIVKTRIKETKKLHLPVFTFSHQLCAFRPIFSQVYKSVSINVIHLKSNESTVPPTIYDPYHVSSITKGKKITKSFELLVTCINIDFFQEQFCS